MIDEKLRQKLLPKRVIFFQPEEDAFIENAILFFQSLYSKETYGEPSKYAHIGFIGNDGLFYESTIGLKGLKWQDGIEITNIENRFKACRKDYDEIGIQELPGITDEQWTNICYFAQCKKLEKISYAFFELFGTLWTLIKWKLTRNPAKRQKILEKANVLNNKNVYCIAFVSDCFEQAGVPYTPKVENSVTTVDMGWHTPVGHINETYSLREGDE